MMDDQSGKAITDGKAMVLASRRSLEQDDRTAAETQAKIVRWKALLLKPVFSVARHQPEEF